MQKLQILLCFVVVLTLVACSSNKKEEGETVDGETVSGSAEETVTVEQLYNEAADLLDQENYTSATRKFEDVERQFPYSKWATKAQLMAAISKR